MKLKDYINEDKPREKLIRSGVESLSDSELLCILLRTGNKNESVNELVNRILKESTSLSKLSEMSFNTLTKIDGIKTSKATTLLAAFEIGKRINKNNKSKVKLSNSEEIFEFFKRDFIGVKQEKFYLLLFDTKMNLIKKEEIFKGTIDSVNMHPREVFRTAILEGATFIIIMHNHPSGDTTPSDKDIEATNQFIKAGEIIGIKVVDHIIISSENYYSFYANSLNNCIK